MSVYNWNFKIIISKCLEPEYNFLHHCFSHFDNEIHDKMSCITKLKKPDFFFPRKKHWKSKREKVKASTFFFFFLFLEGIYFHHSVIFKKKPKKQQKHVFYKTICKTNNPPIKIQIELGLIFSWESFWFILSLWGENSNCCSIVLVSKRSLSMYVLKGCSFNNTLYNLLQHLLACWVPSLFTFH